MPKSAFRGGSGGCIHHIVQATSVALRGIGTLLVEDKPPIYHRTVWAFATARLQAAITPHSPQNMPARPMLQAKADGKVRPLSCLGLPAYATAMRSARIISIERV